MILVTLWGGLGNQMFQYAAGQALAMRAHRDLRLDITHLTDRGQMRTLDNGGTPRGFELADFNIRADAISDREVRKYIPTENSTLAERVVIRARKITGRLRHYQAPEFGYDEKFENLSGSIALSGRFRSHRYFAGIREELKRQFRPKSIRPAAAEVISSINRGSAIGLHVRRGDLISNPTYSYIGWQASDYFEEAYARIRSQDRAARRVYVFSDDIEWCRSNLGFLENPIYVSGDGGMINAHEEFEMMKHCRHLIISNSTFSWWAAWLKEDVTGMVVTPRTWVREPAVFADEVCPPDWVQV